MIGLKINQTGRRGLTLDRIDNDKGYNPYNCTFSTRNIQSINQRQQSNNTSGYVGVTWDKRRNKWSARVHIFKRGKHIGYYLNKEEVQARDNYITQTTCHINFQQIIKGNNT